jgi:hypothetical protein
MVNFFTVINFDILPSNIIKRTLMFNKVCNVCDQASNVFVLFCAFTYYASLHFFNFLPDMRGWCFFYSLLYSLFKYYHLRINGYLKTHGISAQIFTEFD